MQKTKVAVVDDHKLFLELLSEKIAAFPDVEVCWTAADGVEARGELSTSVPEVMFVDFDMPRMNGLQLVRYLREHHPEVKIIMLTSFSDDQVIFDVFNEGVSSYLLKDENVAKIRVAIQTIMQDVFYFPDYVLRAIQRMTTRERQRRKADPQRSVTPENPLSRRETEVLQLLCQPLNNDDVAEELSIAPRTVETHRANIIEKTGADNLFGAAMIAIRNGWINLREG